jgi:hypothetical protein
MFRMNGISRYESRDGLGRAKQDARAESTWMCGAIASVLHKFSSSLVDNNAHRTEHLPDFHPAFRCQVHAVTLFYIKSGIKRRYINSGAIGAKFWW